MTKEARTRTAAYVEAIADGSLSGMFTVTAASQLKDYVFTLRDTVQPYFNACVQALREHLEGLDDA